MEEKGGMVEDAMTAAVKPVAESSSAERSIDAAANDSTSKPLDVKGGDDRCDDGTQSSQTPTNPNTSDDGNDASENAARTLDEQSKEGDKLVGEEAKAVPSTTTEATNSDPGDMSEEGNDKPESSSPAMKGPEDEVAALPKAASSSSIGNQNESTRINDDGVSPRACPCVYVTSSLIGMSLSGRSGSEQLRRHRRQDSGLIEDDERSSNSKPYLLGVEADRASQESALPSSPTASPSRSPGKRRRRPGISPLQRSTSDGDTDLGSSDESKQWQNKGNDLGGQNGHRQRTKNCGDGVDLDLDSTPSAFLAEHHSNHFLCLNLTGAPADSQTAFSFNNQIINCPWTAFDLTAKVEPASSSGGDATVSSSAGKNYRHRSPSTPSLAAMLDICYTIDAYQSLGSENIACLYCENGRTRTGIAIACYLKYEGQVRTSLDGFRLFCAKCSDATPEEGQCRDEQDVASLIPPSLLQLFCNFDDLVDLRRWPNPHPLRLRAVIMQGVPVDHLPVVEIWSGAKGQIYDSHRDDLGECQSEAKAGLLGASSQWGFDVEEGFYIVDKDIQGEFTLTCRFGGAYADDTHDLAQILFRVTNHCAFFTWGPNEFRRGKVDIMRRYADSFEDDFSLVLLFEPVGGLSFNVVEHTTAAAKSYLPPIRGGIAAIEQGLRLIAEHHSLQFEGGNDDSNHNELLSYVARQITNDDDVLCRRVVASQHMVGMKNAIGVYKSRLVENEKGRFNPIIPTSETSSASNAKGTGNPTGLVDQSISSETESVEEEDEVKKSTVDPRATLLSAIKSNGSSTKSEDRTAGKMFNATEKVSDNSRTALLGAIKATKTAHTAENGDVDPRASMLSAIRTRQTHDDADEKSEKEEIEPSSLPIDPRAAMLSAIKAKKPHDCEKEAIAENAFGPSPPLDPRAAMLSAIKARQKPAGDNDETTEKEEARPGGVPPLDPRAAMLAAIKAKQKPTEDNNASKSKEEGEKSRRAIKSSDRVFTAVKARGTHDKSSQLLDLLDTIALGCDDTMGPGSISCNGVDTGGRFHPSTSDYAPYSQSFTPSPGDVVKAFGSCPPSSKKTNHIPQEAPDASISRELYPRPHLPLHASLESDKLRPMQQFLARFESREDIASCIELLDKMPRSGIQIDDLMNLLAQSRRWSRDELNRIQQTMAKGQSAIANASLTREGAAANAAAALAGQFQIASDSSAAGALTGPSKGAQAAADAVSQRLANNASVSQIAKGINQGEKDKDNGENKADDGDGGNGDNGIRKLKDDPLYSKYFRMLKVGLPVGAVKNALQRDGQDPSIMDLDQNRPIQIQLDERNKYREFEMSEWM